MTLSIIRLSIQDKRIQYYDTQHGNYYNNDDQYFNTQKNRIKHNDI